MLLSPNRKKMATIIVSGASSPDFVQKLGEESKTGEFELPKDEASLPVETAMEEFLDAVEKKDAKAMAKAFKNAMYICEGGEPESEASE